MKTKVETAPDFSRFYTLDWDTISHMTGIYLEEPDMGGPERNDRYFVTLGSADTSYVVLIVVKATGYIGPARALDFQKKKYRAVSEKIILTLDTRVPV